MFNQFSEKMTFLDKIKSFDYILLIVVLIIGIISCFAMYSTDGGDFQYYTYSHILRFSVFFAVFIIFSFIRIKFWHITGYLIYAIVLAMLFYVLFFGILGRGF